MFWTLINRTILFELARVFAMSLLGITGLLVMAGIVAEASQQGLGPAQILAIIPLLVPSTLPYTIPATTLFATCVVYGRLAHDNEILAIKAAGINLLKVLKPAFLLGVVTSAATMGLYYSLIPYTHFLLRSQFVDEVEEYLYAVLKKDGAIKQPGLDYSIWVRHVQGRRLQDALFKKRGPNGHYEVIARAREAELHYDAARRLVLVHMHHCQLFSENSQGATGYVQERVWEVPVPQEPVARNTRPRTMAYPDLFARIGELHGEIDKKAAEIALAMTRLNISRPPDTLPQHMDNLKNMQQHFKQEVYALETEANLRPALSCGCLCFVLVGCPVGIWLSRSDYLSAFISCFLPIVFIYYPIVLCSTNLAKQNRVSPSIIIWAADALMAVIAAALFRRLLKH